MEFFETSEKVVVYMNKKRLELLITHLGKVLTLNKHIINSTREKVVIKINLQK